MTHSPSRTRRRTALLAAGLIAVGGTAACGSGGGTAGAAADGALVGFLMPDQASTRYEVADAPGFIAGMEEECPDCEVVYQNADGDATTQQQQFNSLISRGAEVIVLDPVDSSAAAGLVQQAQGQGVEVIAYDRPIPDVPADYYVSFDNEAIGRSIATSLVEHLESEGVTPEDGGVLQVNGSPTDAAAGLIADGITAGLQEGGWEPLAVYDTPDWVPARAQEWVSGQISRFGDEIVGVVAANDGTAGGTIAAFKAAGVEPVPPVTGNDATIAGLQLIIAGDQFNTISKPSEIVAQAAAEVTGQFLAGEEPEAETELFGTPTQLFEPTVVTADNLRAEIIETGIEEPADLCTGRYARGCAELGIS